MLPSPAGVDRRSALLVVAALAALAPSRPASAEENRWNIHAQLGALMTVKQPAVATNQDAFTLPGFNLRLSFEWALHERIGIDLGYGINVLIHNVNSAVDPQQLVFAGARVRPWWNARGGYVLPRPEGRDARPIWAGDYLSDFWIDAHVGIATGVPSVDAMLNRAVGVRFVYDVGLGTRVAVVNPLQVGLFARWQHEITTGVGVMQVVVGVSLDLGFSPVHPQPDEDHDGVPDAIDKCPGSARGVRVNERGCEIRESETKEPKCSDTDLDGVCDGQDDCPETPLGTTVDRHGCPVGGNKPAETPGE